MESILLRLQNLKIDTHRQLSEHFKLKVQLEEQKDDNEVKLHHCRGVIAGLDEMERVIKEVMEDKLKGTKGDEFEGLAMEKPK